MSIKEMLEARISKLFGAAKTTMASDVAAMLEETSAALEVAKLDEDKAETVALDPALGPDEAEIARQELDKARFRVKRLQAAVERLTHLETERQEAEEDTKKREAYENARQLRDAAADMIRTRYPGIQRELLAIIDRLAVSYEAVNAVNRDLPKGEEGLDHAEGFAFGYPETHKERPVGPMPAHIAEMIIPDFHNWSVPAYPPMWNGYGRTSVMPTFLDLHRKRNGSKK